MLERKELAPEDPRHGYRGYTMGCSCQICRNANAERSRAYRASRPQMAADDPRHGTANGYNNQSCRCEPCRAAGLEQNRPYVEAWKARQREGKQRHERLMGGNGVVIKEDNHAH